MNRATETTPGWNGETAQNGLYKPFLRGALVTVLTIGCSLGALNLAVMGLRTDLGAVWWPLIQAHAYAQIFGWVGLFIMGIAYHMVPRFYLRPLRRPGLAPTSFLLVLAGLVLRFVSQPFASYAPAGWLMALSALLGLVGMSLFAGAMYDTMRHGADKFGPPAVGLFIGAGFAWLWLAALVTTLVMVALALQGRDLIPAAWDTPYLRVMLSGAIVTVVLGFTLRLAPPFFGVRLTSGRSLRAVFIVYTLAVLAQVVAETLLPPRAGAWLALLGAAGETIAIVAFIAVLRLFAPGEQAQREKRNPWPERFIRGAYGWLIIAALLNCAFALDALLAGQAVPHAFVASYHHALTVGFISTMIVGMSMKLVPAFIGAMNKRPRAAGLIFAGLMAGITLRVVSESMAYLYGGVFYTLMGLSGSIEVCALAGYAVLLWRALNQPSYGPQAANGKQRAGFIPLQAAPVANRPANRGAE